MEHAKTLCQIVGEHTAKLASDTFYVIETSEFEFKKGLKASIGRHHKNVDLRLEQLMQSSGSIATFPSEDLSATLDFLRNLQQVPSSAVVKILRKYKSTADLERELSLMLSKRKSINSLMSKLADGAAIAGSIPMLLHTQPEYGFLYFSPIIAAAAFYAVDIIRKKDGVFSIWNSLAMAANSIPPLEFLYSYLAGDAGALQHAGAYALFPLAVLAQNILIAARGSYVLSRMSSTRKGSSGFRKDSRQLQYIVGEVRAVQSIDGFAESLHVDKLAAFEEACMAYLDTGSGKSMVKESKERLEAAYKPQTMRTVPETAKASRTLSMPSGEKFYANTYKMLKRFQIEDETAKRIARTVSPYDAADIVTKLQSALPTGFRQVILANPGIFFFRGEDKGSYFAELYRLLGQLSRFGQLPSEYYPRNNPVAFATLDGVQFLNAIIGTPKEIAADVLDELMWRERFAPEGYSNFHLVKAMLVRGFRLGSKRPLIGQSYGDYVNIKRRTSEGSGVNSRAMMHFDESFGRLISDGVILDGKEYKTGGGRFPSCYSVTPSLNDISKPTLKAYVRHLLYGKTEIRPA